MYIIASKKVKVNKKYIIFYIKLISILIIAKLMHLFYKQARLLLVKAIPKLLVYLIVLFLNIFKQWVNKNLGINFNLNNKRNIKELYIIY